MTTVTRTLAHLSEKPWSEFTASDYSIEQWHASCLIHQHEGPPTSKVQCKLPVKTPRGIVNRNGVHAAAAALAGARGGVNASPEQKASAAKELIRLYREMDEEPPPSLLKHSNVENFLSHYGKKGMKWGVRTKRTGKEQKVRSKRQKLSKRRRTISDEDLKKYIERLSSEKKLKNLIDEDLKPGKTVAKRIMSDSGQRVARTVVAGAALYGIKAIVEKKFSAKDAVGYIAPRPKK